MPDLDPLSILSTDITPTPAAASFTDELRTRLERVLTLPRGVMSMTATPTPPPAVERVPRPGALPYLAVPDARRAIEFYRAVFAAEVVGDPYVMDDGRIGHCELAMGGGIVYLADAHPEIGVVAPDPSGASVSLVIAVEDTDAALQRVRNAGGTVQREPYENYGARIATVLDPAGHRWMLSGPVTASESAEPIRHGDVGYVSWNTPDADRAARFWGIVLGWTYETDSGPRRRVRDTSIHTGIDGGHETSTLFCCYAVDDVDEAAAAVRAAGATVLDVQEPPWGRTVDCTDPQGLSFAMFQRGSDTPRLAQNGSRTGDASYLTYRTPDSQTFRGFYGAVLGWTFAPGRVEDGWQVNGCAPMSGVAGDAAAASIVPMWKVADVVAAVERVVAAGGRVIEAPSQQPYGMTSECEDDQGGRFYLGNA
ncbi:MAG: VOC family protein [Jatrophihabitans sp.]